MDIENHIFTLYYVIFYAQLVMCASLVYFPSFRENQMNESSLHSPGCYVTYYIYMRHKCHRDSTQRVVQIQKRLSQSVMLLGRIWKAGEGHKRKLVVLSVQLEHAMASPPI